MKRSLCQIQDKEVQEEKEEQVLDGGLDVVQRQGGEQEEDEEEATGDGAHRSHVRDHDRGRGVLKLGFVCKYKTGSFWWSCSWVGFTLI